MRILRMIFAMTGLLAAADIPQALRPAMTLHASFDRGTHLGARTNGGFVIRWHVEPYTPEAGTIRVAKGSERRDEQELWKRVADIR